MQLSKILLSVALLLAACTPSDKGSENGNNGSTDQPESTTTASLVGTWETVSFRIEIDGVNGSDRDSSFVINKEDFPELLEFTSTRAIYREDGSYEALVIRPDNSVTPSGKGTWTWQGDTVRISQTIPAEEAISFYLKMDGDVATAKSMTDWDGDGDLDLMEGSMVRLSK